MENILLSLYEKILPRYTVPFYVSNINKIYIEKYTNEYNSEITLIIYNKLNKTLNLINRNLDQESLLKIFY